MLTQLKTSEVLQYTFEDFDEGGEKTRSEEQKDCNRNSWTLSVSPSSKGGSTNTKICLKRETFYGKQWPCKVQFRIRNAVGAIHYETSPVHFTFSRYALSLEHDNVIGRDTLVSSEGVICDGSLLVDVEIQYGLRPQRQVLVSQFHKKSKNDANLLRLLDSGDDADINLKFEGTVIPAHRLILKMNAPFLYSLCESKEKGTTDVTLSHLTLQVCRILLRYIYGAELPSKKTVMAANEGKDIIDAAHMYKVIGVKIAVEEMIVGALVIDATNVVDWILYADTKKCPLIMEYCLQYYILREPDLVQAGSTRALDASPHLLHEIISLMRKMDDRVETDENVLSVAELRHQLEEKGLELDGSRAMLVKSLQTSNKRSRETAGL